MRGFNFGETFRFLLRSEESILPYIRCMLTEVCNLISTCKGRVYSSEFLPGLFDFLDGDNGFLGFKIRNPCRGYLYAKQ